MQEDSNKEGKSINELIPDQKKLAKYIIPSKFKKPIIDQLNILGISNRTLFQDLESSSKDIQLEFSNPLRKLWGQPEIK